MYLSKALLMISWKLVDEDEAVAFDMTGRCNGLFVRRENDGEFELEGSADRNRASWARKVSDPNVMTHVDDRRATLSTVTGRGPARVGVSY